MKKLGFVSVSLPLMLASGIGYAGQMSYTSILGGSASSLSAKQSTIGLGSNAMSAGETGGSLMSLSNSVSQDIKVSTEVFVNSVTLDQDGDANTNIDSTTIQAHGMVPVTKLSGAKNPTGFGIAAAFNNATQEVEQNNASVKSDLSTDTIGVYGTVGIKEFDAGLNLTNVKRTREEKATDDREVSYNKVSLSGAYNMSDDTRIAAIYELSSYDFYDDGVTELTENGETASLTLSGSHNLNSTMTLTSGLQRSFPEEIEKDNIKAFDQGETVISVGAQQKMGAFIPRAGITSMASTDNTAQMLAIGTDYVINKIVITGDVAYLNGTLNADDSNTKATISGVNFSAGISTMF